MARKQAKKPAAFRLGRNAELGRSAQCVSWQSLGRPFGRTVELPECCFDEADAKRMRRLADWLRAAADWVEANP